jgi:hypothetical protein
MRTGSQHVSADFVRGRVAEAEMNRLAEGATPSKQQRLMEIFEISSQYEWLFWEMCWKGEAWPIASAAEGQKSKGAGGQGR